MNGVKKFGVLFAMALGTVSFGFSQETFVFLKNSTFGLNVGLRLGNYQRFDLASTGNQKVDWGFSLGGNVWQTNNLVTNFNLLDISKMLSNKEGDEATKRKDNNEEWWSQYWPAVALGSTLALGITGLIIGGATENEGLAITGGILTATSVSVIVAVLVSL